MTFPLSKCEDWRRKKNNTLNAKTCCFWRLMEDCWALRRWLRVTIVSNNTCDNYDHTGQHASHMRPYMTPCTTITNLILSSWSTQPVRYEGSSISVALAGVIPVSIRKSGNPEKCGWECTTVLKWSLTLVWVDDKKKLDGVSPVDNKPSTN